jgi:hypothetical protein
MGAALLRAMGEKRNYAALAARMAALNPGSKDRHLDRRKLKKIVEGSDLTLSTQEIAALDEFLEPFGEGLADVPFLSKPSVLRTLAASGNVTFALAAYPREKERRNDVSAFDVRSMAEIMRGLERIRPGVHIDIEDVIPNEIGRASDILKNLQKSVCSIGSPRTCDVSKAMLATMLGERDGEGGAEQTLAIRFERRKDKSFIQVGQEWFVLYYNDDAESWADYGLVALQRREHGGVWMVVAGLSAASTYACARAVKDLMVTSVDEVPRGMSPVRWAVVEANVTWTAAPGDPRTVKSQKVVATGLLPAVGA